MYEVDLKYEGSFKYTVASLNYEMKIDFPKPDGSTEGVTPPALLLASLGSCMAVYVERYLSEAKISFKKIFINIKSDICKDAPRYLKVIDAKIDLEGAVLDDKSRDALLRFIKNCPVHSTLMHKPEINVNLGIKI